MVSVSPSARDVLLLKYSAVSFDNPSDSALESYITQQFLGRNTKDLCIRIRNYQAHMIG